MLSCRWLSGRFLARSWTPSGDRVGRLASRRVIEPISTGRATLSPLQTRGHVHWAAPLHKEFNRRREAIRYDNMLKYGKDPVSRRSDFLEWNYDSELYALCARLSEQLDHEKLREAFTEACWAQSEVKRVEKLGLNLPQMHSNERLSTLGESFVRDTLEQFLRAVFPYLPEEGVQAFVEHLVSEELLSDISYHIGCRDLIQVVDYPPSRSVHRRVFLALVGALLESPHGGSERAKQFVLDLVAKHLSGVRDICELWEDSNPMKTVATILKNEGRGEPEARLLWVSGPETVMACFHVGVYSDKTLIGQCNGESPAIAEEMAARDTLRRFFRLENSRTPFPTGARVEDITFRTEPNLSVSNWTRQGAEKHLTK